MHPSACVGAVNEWHGEPRRPGFLSISDAGADTPASQELVRLDIVDRLIFEPGWRAEIGHIPAHGLEGIE
jgi:hypothetical protein